MNLFPYLEHYEIRNCNPNKIKKKLPLKILYIEQESIFFPPCDDCIICRNCLLENQKRVTLIAPMSRIGLDEYPHYETLAMLRYFCEIYMNPDKRGNELTKTCVTNFSKDANYQKSFYRYLFKKNNLLVKKELLSFFAQRNLSVLKKYFPISNDIVSLILKRL